MIQSLKPGREQKINMKWPPYFYQLGGRIALGGKHTKIDPDWPIAEVFIYESDYDPRMAWNKKGETSNVRVA